MSKFESNILEKIEENESKYEKKLLKQKKNLEKKLQELNQKIELRSGYHAHKIIES